MRRSRSLSSIPLPLHLRRDSKTREGSKSTLRQSRDRSADGYTPSYRPGTSKTPCTPSFSIGTRRYGSSNCFGPRTSFTRTKSPAVPSIQKHVNDKKWVSEQYSKVQTFIQHSGRFNPELAGLIRPPTINIFVELMYILFDQLLTTGPINSQNYVEVISSNLKILRYPYTITMSTIKSANTMHGWPQFICMVSWLIDQVNLISFAIKRDEETQKISDCQQILWDFFITHYNNFTDGAQEELIAQVNHNLFSNLAYQTETDLETVENYKTYYEALNSEVNDLEMQIEEITSQNHKIEASNLEKKQVIKKFQDNKGEREQEIDEEIQHLQKTVSKKREKRDNLTSSIKELKQDIATQSCKISEKADILNDIEDLTRVVSRKENKLSEYRSIRDDLDRNLRAKVVEIESRVDVWNVSLTKTLLSEVKYLHLREKGFHSGDFLQEITEKLKEKEHIEKHLLEDLKTFKIETEKMQRDKTALSKEIKEFQEKGKRLDELRKTALASKEDIQNNILKIEAVKKSHENNISDLEKCIFHRMQDEETKIKDLDNQIQQASQTFNNIAKKGLATLLEAHQMTTRHFSNIDEKMHAILLNLMAASEQDRNILSKTYEKLTDVKEFTEKLCTSLNEDL